MNQFFVVNPKGGCGKTTIATQMASFFANHGVQVLLLDHDAQKSSHDWLKLRPESLPRIDLRVASADVPVLQQKACLVIHDMPAAWSLDCVSEILHPGDRVVIPVLPSPTDIKACLRFIMGLSRFGVMERGIDVGLVANRVRMNTRFYKTLEVFLERLNLPLITSLRDSQNYVRVMENGLSIFDLPPSKARRDLQQWQPLLDWLEADILIRDFGHQVAIKAMEAQPAA